MLPGESVYCPNGFNSLRDSGRCDKLDCLTHVCEALIICYRFYCHACGLIAVDCVQE